MEIREAAVPRMKAALGKVHDPRQQGGDLRHKLLDVLGIGLCAITLRGEGFEEMEEVGRDREEWFRQFLELPYGIPDEDTFRRVFERVNPGELMMALQGWLSEMSESGGVRSASTGKR